MKNNWLILPKRVRERGGIELPCEEGEIICQECKGRNKLRWGEGRNSTCKGVLNGLPSALSPKHTFYPPHSAPRPGEVGPCGPEQPGSLTLWLRVGFAQLGASTGAWREGEK